MPWCHVQSCLEVVNEVRDSQVFIAYKISACSRSMKDMNFISSRFIIPALSRTKSENMLQNVYGTTYLLSSWGSLTDSPLCSLDIYNIKEFWVYTSCW
jgi:hypothetical protein